MYSTTQPPVSPEETVSLHAAADRYIATFAARRDVFSFWSEGEGDIPPHWQVAKERHRDPDAEQGPPLWGYTTSFVELSPRYVVDAIAKRKPPISGYYPAGDNTTPVVALDFDRDDGWELGMRVLKIAAANSLIAYIERSRRGCHVWIPIAERMAAVAVRRAMARVFAIGGMGVCVGSGLPPRERDQGQGQRVPARCSACPHVVSKRDKVVGNHADPRLEIRPETDDVRGGVGHALRLPTMLHPKVGKRARLIGTDGIFLPMDLVGMMNAVEYTDPRALMVLAEQAPLPKITMAPTDLKYPQGRPEVEQTITEVLREFWNVPMARAGRAIRCPAHDDRSPSLSIAKDDERCWCHSPACDLNNDGRGVGPNQLRKIAEERKA